MAAVGLIALEVAVESVGPVDIDGCIETQTIAANK